MSHVLRPEPNRLYIIEGKEYTYDSEEYRFVKSMKYKTSANNPLDNMFKLKIDMQDPLYDKKEDFYPLERIALKAVFRSNYVGILYDQTDKVLISLPKYTQRLIDIESYDEAITCANKYWEQLKELMEQFRHKLIRRDPLFYTCADVGYNEFAFARAFFAWYAEHDLYNQTSQEYSSTTGRTLWGTTVNREAADIINKKPIYKHVVKTRYVSQQNNITQLQMAILNYLYIEKGYREKLNNIFSNPAIETFAADDTDINIKEILQDENKKQYWIDKIQYAKQMNFRDDYDELFSLILHFLNSNYLTDTQDHGIYGLFKFDNLFEVILSEYFGNQFTPERSSTGKINTTLRSTFLNETILDINQRYYNGAKYTISANGQSYTYTKHPKDDNKGLLIPDIIFEIDYNKKYVVLIDAKYYNYHIENDSNDVSKFPENYDVTKQVYYAKILEAIYKEQNKDVKIINMFIMPWNKNYKQSTKLWGPIGKIQFNNQDVFILISNFDKILIDIKKRQNNSTNRRIELLDAIIKTIGIN